MTLLSTFSSFSLDQPRRRRKLWRKSDARARAWSHCAPGGIGRVAAKGRGRALFMDVSGF